MSIKSDKTTGSKSRKKPEAVIEADLKVTVIIKDEISKEEARQIIEDMFIDGPDNLQIKDVKVFQRGV